MHSFAKIGVFGRVTLMDKTNIDGGSHQIFAGAHFNKTTRQTNRIAILFTGVATVLIDTLFKRGFVALGPFIFNTKKFFVFGRGFFEAFAQRFKCFVF